MGKNIGKNISKNLSGKYSQKLINHAKQSATNTFNTALYIKYIYISYSRSNSWLVIKLLIELRKFHETYKTSEQINSELVTNEHDKEIPKKTYISPRRETKSY